MDGDDLNRPLGLDRDPPRQARDIPWGGIALGGIGVLGLGLFVFNRLVVEEPRSGEPFAVASIERAAAPAAAPAPAPGPTAAVAAPAAAASAMPPATDGSDIENGVRVVRNGGAGAPGALIINVPDVLGLQLAPAPDKRLVETSPHGLLPKIGTDGTRPMEAYARPVSTSPKLPAHAPRLAVVIGGMGISRTATDHAVEVLPGAVTLAFAPYGSEVPSLAAKARGHGHELLLQVPMEPFDAAQMPGPRALRTDLESKDNLDHLHWAMGRFAGYVGIINYMGAKFTAREASLVPVERDVARRGLLWLDDGTSARSVSREVAGDAGLSFLQAQVNLEGAAPQAIDAALARAEREARDRGAAILVATGLPDTVDRVAAFARDLEQRGIALVPVSALVDQAGRKTASAPAE